MADILSNFFGSVFPVALMFFLGFTLGRRGIFAAGEVSSLFKFIAQLAAPAIVFSIMITSEFGDADMQLIGLYFAAEGIVYLATMLLAMWGLGLDLKNGILAAMAASFSNHVLFAYPISQFAFAPDMIVPIQGIIAIDMAIFTLTIVALDMNAGARDGMLAALLRQRANPLLLALLAGLCIRLLPGEPYMALIRSAEFAARTAAPLGLFATGVVLSAPISGVNLRLAGLVTFMKMVAHPGIAAFLMLGVGGYAFDPSRTSLLVAVAPVGVMALTFSNRFQGESGAIAMAILWSMVASVLMIPVLIAI